MKNSEILVENSMCKNFQQVKYKTAVFIQLLKVSSKMGYNMDERTKEWMINLRKVGVEVRKFDYMKLADRLWDGEVVSYIAKIHECKGRQELFTRQKPVELERLIEIARVRVQRHQIK